MSKFDQNRIYLPENVEILLTLTVCIKKIMTLFHIPMSINFRDKNNFIFAA